MRTITLVVSLFTALVVIALLSKLLPPSAAADYIRRYDCMYSNKGGKRNKDGDKNRPLTNLNPCWCHEHAICLDAATGDEQGSTRERHAQLQRLLSRPFSTRFG